MNSSIELSKPTPVNTVSVDNLNLSASTPQEMQSVQSSLIQWCEKKILSLMNDYDDLDKSYEHAKKMKWKTTTLLNHRNKTMKRVEYYSKMKSAFEAGYILVPNMPIGIFAVRTDREYPKQVMSFWNERFEQKATGTPEGEGEYKNPLPLVRTNPENKEVNEKTGQMVVKPTYWPDEFVEIDFPMNMAKPHIMEATSHAMGLKIFDEIGVLPDPRRKADPVIIGTVKIKEGYNEKVASFLISWHVDTRTL